MQQTIIYFLISTFSLGIQFHDAAEQLRLQNTSKKNGATEQLLLQNTSKKGNIDFSNIAEAERVQNVIFNFDLLELQDTLPAQFFFEKIKIVIRGYVVKKQYIPPPISPYLF